MPKRRRKALAYKRPDARGAAVWSDAIWSVKKGHLSRPRGRPGKIEPLFKALGEKLPYGALDEVEASLQQRGIPRSGIYMAHDSMGAPRYIGRGSNMFTRLRSHKKAHKLELLYFSFYVVKANVHEREIETLLIRGASHLLAFNDRKKRVGLSAGSIYDYEPGTQFYERQYKKGRKKKRG